MKWLCSCLLLFALNVLRPAFADDGKPEFLRALGEYYELFDSEVGRQKISEHSDKFSRKAYSGFDLSEATYEFLVRKYTDVTAINPNGILFSGRLPPSLFRKISSSEWIAMFDRHLVRAQNLVDKANQYLATNLEMTELFRTAGALDLLTADFATAYATHRITLSVAERARIQELISPFWKKLSVTYLGAAEDRCFYFFMPQKYLFIANVMGDLQAFSHARAIVENYMRLEGDNALLSNHWVITNYQGAIFSLVAYPEEIHTAAQLKDTLMRALEHRNTSAAARAQIARLINPKEMKCLNVLHTVDVSKNFLWFWKQFSFFERK